MGGAFDSNNTAYQQQQHAIAQGAVSQPGAADLIFRQPSMGGQGGSRPTSLDGRCMDAIMALGSSGDSAGGGMGGGCVGMWFGWLVVCWWLDGGLIGRPSGPR
jgi:hypothetical protein